MYVPSRSDVRLIRGAWQAGQTVLGRRSKGVSALT
jgi:hypothetical protein